MGHLDSPVTLISVKEVARRLSVSVDEVHRIASRGHLRIIHVGRHQRVRAGSVERYIESLERDPWNRHMPPASQNRRSTGTRTA